MIVSLNEIETTVLKAARGAGLAWGLAEEAAFAARWLAERGIEWLEPMAAALDKSTSAAAIELGDGAIRTADGATPLCPLRIGAFVADLGLAGLPMSIARLHQPILLVPFVAAVARRGGAEIALAAETTLSIRPDGYSGGRGNLDRLARCETADVVLSRAAAHASPHGLVRRRDPAVVDPQLWSRLAVLEARTYVPASTQSRLAGAGAGLSDND